MQIFGLVAGLALIVAAGAGAIQQVVVLARRYKRAGVLQLISLPAAWRFRFSLILIAVGVMQFQSDDPAGQWTIIGLWAALVGWHCALWLRYRLPHRRPAQQ
jgi:hypothetical protein